VALQNLGSIAALRRDFDEAEERFARSGACFRAAGYRRGEAFALNNRGRILLDRGDAAAALDVLAEAVGVALEVQDMDLHALSTLNLAEAYQRLGRLDPAERCLAGAAAHYRRCQNPWRTIDCLRVEGDLALARGTPEPARAAWTRAAELAETLRARVELVEVRGRLARLDAQERA
jgi:tetratricopeptide (TPR) repeat protein